jgi:hypothetical protein
MGKKVIKINTNPNISKAPGMRNPTAAAEYNQDYYENVVNPDAPPKRQGNIKISSNPATGVPGKTRIGNLAKGGAGIGGMFGVKNR